MSETFVSSQKSTNAWTTADTSKSKITVSSYKLSKNMFEDAAVINKTAIDIYGHWMKQGSGSITMSKTDPTS